MDYISVFFSSVEVCFLHDVPTFFSIELKKCFQIKFLQDKFSSMGVGGDTKAYLVSAAENVIENV